MRKRTIDWDKKSKGSHFRHQTILFLIIFLYACAMGNLYYAKNGILTDHIAFSETDPSILIGINEKYRYTHDNASIRSAYDYRFMDSLISIDFVKDGEMRFKEYLNLQEGKQFSENGSQKYVINKDTVSHAGIDFICVTIASKNGDQSFLIKEMVHRTVDNDLLVLRFQKNIEDPDFLILVDKGTDYPRNAELIENLNKEVTAGIRFAKSTPDHIKTLKIAVSEGKKIAPIEFSKYFNHPILSTPDTAKVFIDGELKGITPAVVSLRDGLHKIRIEKEGFEPFETETIIDENLQKSEFTLKPVKPPEPPRNPGEYALFINTTPPDADVKIMNISPKFRQGILLKKGSYNIKIEKKGYKSIFETVRIADSDIRLSFRLTDIAKSEESTSKDQIVPTITVDEESLKAQNSPAKRIFIKVADDSGVETLSVNGEFVKVDSNGEFSGEVLLTPGSNRLRIVATDRYNNKAVKIFTVK